MDEGEHELGVVVWYLAELANDAMGELYAHDFIPDVVLLLCGSSRGLLQEWLSNE